MSGRIVSVPTVAHKCQIGLGAGSYEPGTVWQCDDCDKQWVAVRGSQYNETYSAWRPLTERTKDGHDR